MPDPAVLRRKLLSLVLVLAGIAFIAVYGLMSVFPESWGWEPRQYEYEQMIAGVYAVLGVFLLIAARRPEKHLSLIWFAAVSSLVHGFIMLVQALVDPVETPNLYGDIPALILVGLILAALAPKRLA
ncbi:MAG: DUF6632 domain-containing protein [bacterium]